MFQAYATLLCIVFFIIDALLYMFQCKFELISSTPTPDGNLNYNDLLDATEKVCLYQFSVWNIALHVCMTNGYC